MKNKFILFFIIAPLFGLVLGAARIYYSVALKKYEGPAVTFQIHSGEPFSKINYRLGEAGIIDSTKIFHRYCQQKNYLTSFKTGIYEIPTGITMLGVIELFQSGKGLLTSVTIPEGKNLYEIAAILESSKVTSKEDFIQVAKDQAFASELGISGQTLEGYLYPETYSFAPETPARDVAAAMVKVFNEKTSGLDFEASALPKDKVIILASIVEKETGAGFERPLIAGVFLNRLKKRMRLQSDPTTIYGIWENYNGNLRKSHLLEKTDYNTYKISELPVGPIANPGISAIKAVLEPAKHEYLYFVSKNDGTHVFSTNLKDHNRAVDEWQKKSSNRAGRSWRDLNQNQ